MSTTKERKLKIERGKVIIAEQKLEDLDDFLEFFQQQASQQETTSISLQSVRSALPEVVLNALSRDPWKYWEIIYGYPFQGPNPNQH